MQRLSEKYRPRTWSEFIGNAGAVRVVQALCESGLGGRAVWIYGGTGTGKTTLARIAAGTLADDFNIVELAGRNLGLAELRDIAAQFRLYGLGTLSGRVLIVNEAHGLSRPCIEYLLDLLESLPRHCAVVFTTTSDGQERLFDEQIDACPLLDRCVQIKLSNQGLTPLFAARLREIAQCENCDGEPEAYYVKVMREVGHSSMRAGLAWLESRILATAAR
jgi:replication-associated recombination protein RarA